jgi:hypothetical protein
MLATDSANESDEINKSQGAAVTQALGWGGCTTEIQMIEMGECDYNDKVLVIAKYQKHFYNNET